MTTLIASDRLSFDVSADGQTLVIRLEYRKPGLGTNLDRRRHEQCVLQLTTEELFTLQTIISGQWRYDHFL